MMDLAAPPHAIGRSIRSTCLGDGEQTRWNRTDFIGVLREEFLPDWAKEKLAELQAEHARYGGDENDLMKPRKEECRREHSMKNG